MTELLRIIDTLGGAGTVDPAVRRDLDGFITQAVERRGALQKQLAMADEFLALLRKQ